MKLDPCEEQLEAARREIVFLSENLTRVQKHLRYMTQNGREGILTVYDDHGVYRGCIGVETWAALCNQLMVDTKEGGIPVEENNDG